MATAKSTNGQMKTTAATTQLKITQADFTTLDLLFLNARKAAINNEQVLTALINEKAKLYNKFKKINTALATHNKKTLGQKK